MEILKNISLAPYTTFKIGGPAKFFCIIANTEELLGALNYSRENGLFVFILGGGSNILVSDNGFPGLVIKMEILGRRLEGDKIFLGAGENWDEIVAFAVDNKLFGIENLSLIPGTVGAAVYQNIGAYGAELKDVLAEVEVYDSVEGKFYNLSNQECDFSYRNSIFQKRSELVITRVTLNLSNQGELNLTYPDVKKYFENKTPTLEAVREAVIRIRKSKLPYPDELPNAGSFFKNPFVTKDKFDALKQKFPEIRGNEIKDGRIKVSAAKMIDLAGWRDKKIGNVGVSGKHSLVLANYGGGTAQDIMSLAREIKEDIDNKFGIGLEMEPQLIGFDLE